MPWSNRQKYLVHLYPTLAGLTDPERRQVLFEVSQCTSAKHPALTQWHFDQVMARYETVLAQRVRDGRVDRPPRAKVGNLLYWRRRLPADGGANSRLLHKIDALWSQLLPYLPDDKQTDRYLCDIATFACGYHVRDRYALKAWQGTLLVEALKDRLSHALKKAS